ncbi:MAG TPA: Xaa-Pro aminopeptidase [Gaiellaceae bacterium]
MPVLESSPPAASAAELGDRRSRLLDRLPDDAIALVRGARPGAASRRFRQTNDFWYLTALETPGAYLVLDGRSRAATLYVPHRDPLRERPDGPSPSAEDADEIQASTGIDRVVGIERLTLELGSSLFRAARPVYTPLAPAETEAVSRDSALAAAAWAASDPLMDSAVAEGALADAIRRRFPQAEVRDLSPFLDSARLLKSDHELELMRRAARICGEAVMEAMRSTEPGVFEYELEAVADFVYRRRGARGAGYSAIVAGGANAWHGHYSANASELRDGDLVLMDYAPDYAYYTSDIGRMWPVNGRYADWQRELYGFVVAYHGELTARIRPGVTPDEILAGAAAAMRARIEETGVSRASYRAAFEDAFEFAGHLSHPVGMAVHDVGDYRGRPLEPGLVFSVDPMIWVNDERLYVRVEDTVAVTDDGVENLTGFVPLALDDVEALMQEPGLLQNWKRS